MILLWLILILLVGGLLAWLMDRWSLAAPRWISLLALAIDMGIALFLWFQTPGLMSLSERSHAWLAELNLAWIPQLGIGFYLAMDGLSLLLILLTLFIGLLAVLISWTEIQERVGFFHFNLMWILAGIVGVFVALDLFLFYFFWELMLIPMYFLIALWGHENRIYAAVKFFIFTQFSGLLMLISILGLYFSHGQSTGTYTFNYNQLLDTPLAGPLALWLMGGFLAAFLVKLPALPLHTWLPDAHTEAPTAGSVILAGLMLKTGAYGLLRFVLPLFPEAAAQVAPLAMLLGAAGVLYGAMLAFAQTDLKRLVAYTSVSHMGFVLLGVFAQNVLALQGTVMEIICHGISTGALFILVGALQERLHTRDLRRLGGLWAVVPRMGAVALIFAMASLGLPGLGNFVAEILILMGAYQVHILATVLATLGLVLATVYSLWIMQGIFYGPNREGWTPPDLSAREWLVMGSMIAVIVWLGLYPQPVLNTARPALETMAGNGAAQLTEIGQPEADEDQTGETGASQ
jgi:NADH-quinone oxidoreductase subunit M